MILNKSEAILSIDYGERYFGFAVKLKNEQTSFHLKVLDTTEKNVLDVIDGYLQKFEVKKVLVGYPIGLTGNKTRMSDLVDEFIINIKDRFNVNVVPIDERFTSKLVDIDTNERLDSMSAMLLLETFLIENE